MHLQFLQMSSDLQPEEIWATFSIFETKSPFDYFMFIYLFNFIFIIAVAAAAPRPEGNFIGTPEGSQQDEGRF